MIPAVSQCSQLNGFACQSYLDLYSPYTKLTDIIIIDTIHPYLFMTNGWWVEIS